MTTYKVVENDRHWMYFLSLEEDLIRLSRSIEFSERNMDVFSIETTRLFLATCSEVDVLLKTLAAPHVAKERKDLNIGDCRVALADRYPMIKEAVVSIPRFQARLSPFASWLEKRQPGWWDDHTLVKHQRYDHYAKATVSNLLSAMAGLMVVALTYFQETGWHAVRPAPTVMHPYWNQASYCLDPYGHLIDLRSEHLRPEDG